MSSENTLNPEEVSAIESWTSLLTPTLEQYPILSQVDLIVEGGAGIGVTMPQIMHRLWPQAFFVGTDLSQFYAVSHRLPSHQGHVTDATIQRLMTANANWQKFMIGATIHADCFDFALVRDLTARVGASTPMLVSFDAIGHLRDNMRVKSQRRSVADWFNDSQYVAQLHLASYGIDWHNGRSALDQTFRKIEESAAGRGYAVSKFPTGILVVKN